MELGRFLILLSLCVCLAASRTIKGIIKNNSVTQLHVTSNENVFRMIRAPAVNIQSLVLDGEIKLPRNSKALLNEMFPKLRHLTLNSIDVDDPSVFRIRFPHLKYVKIAYPKLPLNEPSKAIENLFKMNSQIENLEVVGCSPNYHRLAVDYLGELESFDATYFPSHAKDKKPKAKRVHFRV